MHWVSGRADESSGADAVGLDKQASSPLRPQSGQPSRIVQSDYVSFIYFEQEKHYCFSIPLLIKASNRTFFIIIIYCKMSGFHFSK